MNNNNNNDSKPYNRNYIKAYIGLCLLSGAAIGFFGFISFDESIGRVYKITQDVMYYPPGGPGGIISFIAFCIGMIVLFIPLTYALRIVAADNPKWISPEEINHT